MSELIIDNHILDLLSTNKQTAKHGLLGIKGTFTVYEIFRWTCIDIFDGLGWFFWLWVPYCRSLVAGSFKSENATCIEPCAFANLVLNFMLISAGFPSNLTFK